MGELLYDYGPVASIYNVHIQEGNIVNMSPAL